MSVVNVAGPTGAPPRAGGEASRVARRAHIAAKRDDLAIAGNGTEVRGDRQPRLAGVGQRERRRGEVDAVVVRVVLRPLRGERLQNGSVGPVT